MNLKLQFPFRLRDHMTEQQDKSAASIKVIGIIQAYYSLDRKKKQERSTEPIRIKGAPGFFQEKMKNSKLKEYLNGFSDDADISLIVANTQNRKVYETKEVIVMTDVEIPAFVIDVCNERDMDAEEISVCEECERNADNLEGQMDITDFPEVMP